MSNIYEIIDSLNLEEAESHKLQIYLIKNPKEEERLFLALKSTYKTKEDKRSLMKDFFNTIPGMLDKIFAVIILYTVCDATTKPFFFLYHVHVDLDEHYGKSLFSKACCVCADEM